MQKKIKRYGWIPDLPNVNDKHFSADLYGVIHLPVSHDMRPKFFPPYDQGQLGSCTGNGIAGALEWMLQKEHLKLVTPSRLFIYFNEREIEGTVPYDAGASISDGIDSVSNTGFCPEQFWPYDISKFADRPPENCYADAHLNHRHAISKERVPRTLLDFRTALAHDIPIVIGFTVYESFESSEVALTGIMPMPKPGEQVLGGHCVLVVGYDDLKREFICRNSWGQDWGAGGYFYMPYDYIINPSLSDDFWVIKKV